MQRTNGECCSLAIVYALIFSQIGNAQICNNDCAIITHQGMPGPGGTATDCGMYTPGQACGSSISWSPNGDPTKQKTEVIGAPKTTYTVTNLNTCSLRCPTQTQSYGLSDASAFVINDPMLEVVAIHKFVQNACTNPAT